MAGMTYRERAVSAAAETAMRYIAGDPEENLPRLLHWAETFDKNGVWERQLTLLRSVLGDQDSVWYQYVMQLYRDIDRAVLQRTVIYCAPQKIARSSVFRLTRAPEWHILYT